MEVRAAVVTGASAGLGVAIARGLGELGWRVAVGARRMERLRETAREIERAGGEAFAHELDVSDPDSVARFFDAAEDAFGAFDTVVNNAGISTPGPLHEQKVEDLEREIATNLLGPMYVSRRAIPRLLERGAGDVVFISSDASQRPRPRQAAYTASKSGVEALARALGMELEGTGIRCTTIRPGPALSEYASTWPPEEIQALLEFWQHFGLQRHYGVMPAEAVARAVVVAVTTPPGVNLECIEVQPEAPRIRRE